MHVVCEAGEGRPAEWLLVDDLELGARRDPTLREVAKHVGVAVGDAHEATAGAGLERGERIGRQLDDLEVAARDRVAVGVALRIAELHRYQLLELLGEHVLEDLRFVVHPVPGHAERLGQVQLEQAMVADDLERQLEAAVGELDAVVGRVAREPHLVEPLDHRRSGRGRHAQALGQGGGGHRVAPVVRQGVDRLRVVLDGDCGSGCLGLERHCFRLKLWHA